MTDRPRPSSLRACLPHLASRAPAVSAWSVGQHVEHCARAAIGVCEALGRSRAPTPHAGPALRRRLILLTGWIPRGVGQAPSSVSPRGTPDAAALAALLDRADDARAVARRLPAGSWFRHFALGVMDRDASLAFLDVHDAHHLRIVRDVFRA